LLNAANKCTPLIEDDITNDFVQVEELDSADCSPILSTEQGEQRGTDTPPEVAQAEAPKTVSTNPTNLDSNSLLLHKVYNALSDASGDGKFGLGSIKSREEASNLADLVGKMRHILMEELDRGIPEASFTKIASTDERTSQSTVTKYQQMLAKARKQ